MEAMLAACQLWAVPLTCYALWWNAAVDSFCPHMARCPHRLHHREHDQLIVPEPLEETGEHALFA
ncbi:hypothetical protein AWL63_22950 (plasmid) [Sphingomonas panacis]|uniref:Uncharacterized protein n=2 Tax=Sphingomonas panacis TaxID=1560345 RepID=A0A1B3ZI02_9SPHN|nr:hypothetical protein AWL63_22950 [Sphingomonas panacis]